MHNRGSLKAAFERGSLMNNRRSLTAALDRGSLKDSWMNDRGSLMEKTRKFSEIYESII